MLLANSSSNAEVKNLSGAYPSMNDGDFAFYLADIFVESVQYGNRTGLCNLMSTIANSTLEEQLQVVAEQAKSAGVAPEDYDRVVLKNTTITDSAGRAWTYQYCTQFGWFQTPSELNKSIGIFDTEVMRSPLLNVSYWYDMCDDIYNTSLKINRSITEFAHNRISGSHTIFTNGDEDPWRWATSQDALESLDQYAFTAECDDCGHCAELYTPKPEDPPELVEVRSKVWSIVNGWLK